MPIIEVPLRNQKNGSTFRFFTKDAEIISDPITWSETHISSSGGGGYVHPQYGGSVSAPTVHSHVVEREKYFVKMENGEERELRDAVTGRRGHHITLIYGGIEGESTYLVGTYNPQLSRYELKRPRYFGKYFTFLPCIPVLGALNGWIAMIIMIAMLFIPVVGVSAVIGLIIAGYLERKKRISGIDAKLMSLIQSL